VPPRISLVVPARDEQELLPRLLDSVDVARRRFAAAGGEVETIVADNASTDATAAVAAGRGCRVVRVEKRRIGAVRNGGAAAATGELLAFTDADGSIHPETFVAIDRAMASGRWVGGATRVAMERWSPGIVATFAVALPWLWLLRIDSGVVFCRRDDFLAVGGYPEELGYAEDLAFIFALRRLGRRDGRRLVRLRGVRTTTSARKFDRHGDWHYFTRMPPLAWRMLFRRSASTPFSEEYWYGRR